MENEIQPEEEPTLEQMADQLLPHLFKRMLEHKDDGEESEEEGSEHEEEEESEMDEQFPLSMTIEEQRQGLKEIFSDLSAPNGTRFAAGTFLKINDVASEMLDLTDAMFATDLCLILNVYPAYVAQNDEETCNVFNLLIAFLKDDCYLEAPASSLWFVPEDIVKKDELASEKNKLTKARTNILQDSFSQVGSLAIWKPNGKFKQYPTMNQPMLIIKSLNEDETCKSDLLCLKYLKLDLLVGYFVQISEDESMFETALVHSSRITKFD